MYIYMVYILFYVFALVCNMNRRYFYRKYLERRVEKLESLLLEKSVGRGGEPSNAMKVWQLLTDNGPMTKAQIQQSGLSATATAGASLNFYVDHDLLTRNGNLFAANPDYAWDDIGVIPRTAQQELVNSIRNNEMPSMDDIDEAPVQRRSRGRVQREPRAPRERAAKQNLFSRKLSEVKAAVEAGQDPTAANTSGKTPLMFACSDPKGESGEIIEYLLEHGANANDVDGKRPVLFACCQRGDSRGIKALVAHGASIDSVWKRTFPVYIALNEGKIRDDSLADLLNERVIRVSSALEHCLKVVSGNAYTAIVDKVDQIVSNESIYGIVPFRILNCDLEHGSRGFIDLYIKRGLVPSISYNAVAYLNNDALKVIYEVVLLASEGKLQIKSSVYDFMQAAAYVCDRLNKDISTATKFITPEWLAKASSDSIESIIRYAVKKHRIDILNTIAKIKRKDINYNFIIKVASGYIGYEKYDAPSDTTRSLCRILNSCLPDPNKCSLDYYSMMYLRTTKNKLFIEYMIDRGFGEILTKGINDLSRVSDEVKNAIKDAGIEIKTYSDMSDDERKKFNDDNDRRYKIEDIIYKIRHDEWSREAEQYVTRNPDVLEDDSILDALDEYSNTITARQLKRKLDQYRANKPKDVYDM